MCVKTRLLTGKCHPQRLEDVANQLGTVGGPRRMSLTTHDSEVKHYDTCNTNARNLRQETVPMNSANGDGLPVIIMLVKLAKYLKMS